MDLQAVVPLPIRRDQLARFCEANSVRRLSLFGSALREDFGPESDLDFLVEFEPGHTPGLIRLAGIEMELARLLHRRVDLVTPNSLSRYFRDRVIGQAQPLYDRTG